VDLQQEATSGQSWDRYWEVLVNDFLLQPL